MMKKEQKLISLYEKIIFGDDNTLGLFDCYDTYYRGSWDNLLNEVKAIKKDINQAPTGEKNPR